MSVQWFSQCMGDPETSMNIKTLSRELQPRLPLTYLANNKAFNHCREPWDSLTNLLSGNPELKMPRQRRKDLELL